MVAGDTNPTGNVTARDNSEGEKLGDYRGIHIAGRDVPSLQGFNIHNVRVHDVSGIVTWIGDTGVRDAGIGNNYGFDGSKRTGGILNQCIHNNQAVEQRQRPRRQHRLGQPQQCGRRTRLL